jgi:hypothetical protein
MTTRPLADGPLRAILRTAAGASQPTLMIGTEVLKQVIDEILKGRRIAEAAHELLDAEHDADNWTDYHTALKAALDDQDGAGR